MSSISKYFHVSAFTNDLFSTLPMHPLDNVISQWQKQNKTNKTPLCHCLPNLHLIHRALSWAQIKIGHLKFTTSTAKLIISPPLSFSLLSFHSLSKCHFYTSYLFRPPNLQFFSIPLFLKNPTENPSTNPIVSIFKVHLKSSLFPCITLVSASGISCQHYCNSFLSGLSAYLPPYQLFFKKIQKNLPEIQAR